MPEGKKTDVYDDYISYTGRKGKNLVEKVQKFLTPEVDWIQSYENSSKQLVNRNYDHLFSQTFNYVRDIPLMLQEPIIGSCVELVMESAFQADEDMKILKTYSPYPKISEELDEFHRSRKMGDYALIIGYNQVLYGNLPIRMNFDDNYELKYFTLVPDFRSVIPLIIGNITLGYQVGDKYHFPHEFVYGQLLYFKDLGGSNALFRFQARDSEKRINEFVFSPSYLAKSVRPWRSIKIISDALLLQRMDQAHYMRLIKVGVGGGVFSKSAVKMLSFYRNLFKKTRRLAIDANSSLTSPSMGQEFELILPQSDNQKVEVQEVGGNIECKALKDLELKIKELFSSLKVRPSMIGYDENEPTPLNGESPVNMWDERFGKTVKTVQYSTSRTIKQIDVLYLRSKGYDVTEDDFQIRFMSPSTVETEKKRITLSTAVKTMGEVIGIFDQMQIEYDKKYLAKNLFETLLSSAIDIDFDILFKNPTKEDGLIQSNKTQRIKNKNEIINEVGEEGKKPSSLIPVDLISCLEYSRDVGKINDDELQAFKVLNAEVIASARNSLSYDPHYGEIKYDRFLSSIDIYSSVNVPVDLSGYVGHKKIIKDNYEIVDNGITLKIESVLTNKTTIKSTDLMKGVYGELDNAYQVGGHIYLDGHDLHDYLYMRDLGQSHFVVKSFWALKKKG